MLAGLLRRAVRSGMRHVPDGQIAAQQAVLNALDFSPETVLRATANGFFPMANESGKIEWRCPANRAVIPVDDFHVRKSLRRVVRSGRFEIRVDSAFDEVIEACAQRPETWITPQLADVYKELFRMGQEIVRSQNLKKRGKADFACVVHTVELTSKQSTARCTARRLRRPARRSARLRRFEPAPSETALCKHRTVAE